MPVPVQDASSFLALVAKSGLVQETVLDAAFHSDIPAQSTQAAEFLIKRGILTAFQARVLLAGKHKGLILGPYKILDQLGRGGMGIVYLAEHQKLQCKRAIKVLPKESTADALALDRFYREARAAANLDHPNIVKAYDVAEEDGVHYFVMEYVQGVNLQTHLQTKGPLPWKAAVGFIGQACKGLQHAHERGMVHRDIKPGNLLVDRSGTLKILDLGLARCFQSEKDNLTGKYANASDEFMGSVDFMAPEVALGDQVIDIRTDIYSLGVTLFSLVIGKPPFEGSPAQKLMHHQLKPIPPLHELKPEVPDMLSAVIARMTHKRVDQRYPTPASVLDALAPWLPRTAGTAGRSAPARATPLTTASTPAAPPSTVRLERQANRDTRPIHAEDTQANSPVSERDDDGRTTRRRRKRFKKKRTHNSGLFWLIALPAAVAIVAVGIWAGLTVFRRTPEPAQVAVVDKKKETPPTPRRPAPPIPPTRTQPPPPETDTPAVAEGFEVGLRAPEIQGEDLDNTEFQLSDYRGKVVLLDFWGFW